MVGEERLTREHFKRAKLGEIIGQGCGATDDNMRQKLRRTLYSPLWQADRTGINRYAPLEFIQRYLGAGFFDYGIADEVHELKGDTAQGSALASLVGATARSVILTGTLLGGYADDLFNILFRLDPAKMLAEGFVHGDVGVRAVDNACSKARSTKRVQRRPGASPLLFGRFLMGILTYRLPSSKLWLTQSTTFPWISRYLSRSFSWRLFILFSRRLCSFAVIGVTVMLPTRIGLDFLLTTVLLETVDA